MKSTSSSLKSFGVGLNLLFNEKLSTKSSWLALINLLESEDPVHRKAGLQSLYACNLSSNIIQLNSDIVSSLDKLATLLCDITTSDEDDFNRYLGAFVLGSLESVLRKGLPWVTSQAFEAVYALFRAVFPYHILTEEDTKYLSEKNEELCFTGYSYSGLEKGAKIVFTDPDNFSFSKLLKLRVYAMEALGCFLECPLVTGHGIVNPIQNKKGAEGKEEDEKQGTANGEASTGNDENPELLPTEKCQQREAYILATIQAILQTGVHSSMELVEDDENKEIEKSEEAKIMQAKRQRRFSMGLAVPPTLPKKSPVANVRRLNRLPSMMAHDIDYSGLEQKQNTPETVEEEEEDEEFQGTLHHFILQSTVLKILRLHVLDTPYNRSTRISRLYPHLKKISIPQAHPRSRQN